MQSSKNRQEVHIINQKEAVMYHCPCCGEEEFEEVGFCLDCRLLLLEGKRPDNHCKLCDCDDHPVGDTLAQRLKCNDGESMDAIAEIANLTGYKDKESAVKLKEYIDALIAFNN